MPKLNAGKQSYYSKTHEIISDSLSLRALFLLKELYVELTLYPDDEAYLYNAMLNKDKFILAFRSSMEGLLKVLLWRLDNTITSVEFT